VLMLFVVIRRWMIRQGLTQHVLYKALLLLLLLIFIEYTQLIVLIISAHHSVNVCHRCQIQREYPLSGAGFCYHLFYAVGHFGTKRGFCWAQLYSAPISTVDSFYAFKGIFPGIFFFLASFNNNKMAAILFTVTVIVSAATQVFGKVSFGGSIRLLL
jgi:hypothetical protein